jgi:hypothetical protein
MMKFISSREIRSNPARLWEVTGSDESVITVNGKPRAIVVAVGEDLEVTLASIRRARAFNALEKIRIYAREKGLENLTDQEIEHEICQARTGR